MNWAGLANARLSAVVLVAANLVPVGGVVFFGWRSIDVLMLYWVENVVIGLINVMRMATTPGRKKWFLIVFFSVHYGIFCFGHLMAINGLFGESLGVANVWDYFLGVSVSEQGTAMWRSPQIIAIGGIAASHLFSYFSNFVGRGEYLRTSTNELMSRPYGRIIVLHVAIIIGAALVEWLGSPVSMLVVLVIAKIALDLRLHLAEREQFQTATS